jgi:predicted DNA-binding transcriptional regulator YafY
MSRARRLLELLEILRRHRYPVTGAALAAELGISPRSLYRDIATLQSQGARIDGAPGLGYILKPGFTLPPLMFSEDEIEALSLGAQWVAERTDAGLAGAARSALAKIASVLPPRLRGDLDASTLVVAPPREPADTRFGLPLRLAIRNERKIRIGYRDARERTTERVAWPFAFAYFDQVRVVAAWCELRQGFRHFRTDRIESLETLPERYPRGRQALMEEWRKLEGIDRPGE